MAERAPDGYAGKILRVNLSNNTTSVEELDEGQTDANTNRTRRQRPLQPSPTSSLAQHHPGRSVYREGRR